MNLPTEQPRASRLSRQPTAQPSVGRPLQLAHNNISFVYYSTFDVFSLTLMTATVLRLVDVARRLDD